jgi:hypothetical protein
MKKGKFISSSRSSPPFFFYSFFFIFIWLTVVLLGVYFFQSFTQEDEKAYQQLMEHSDGIKTNQSSSSYNAHQQRFNIKKHLLLTEEDNRLQFLLHSSHSELVFNQCEDKTEIVEHFQGVKCWMQEALIYTLADGQELKHPINKECMPQQYMRYMEAETATYHYKTKELIAEQVELSRYIIPGHFFTQSFKTIKPFMHGTAKRANFFLSNQHKLFKAYEFQGTLQDLGGSL